jgi:putative membrane protein
MFPLHGAFSLLLLILLVVAAVLVVRALWHRGGPTEERFPARRSEALQILEERYARGEIDRDEFMAKKKDLQ